MSTNRNGKANVGGSASSNVSGNGSSSVSGNGSSSVSGNGSSSVSGNGSSNMAGNGSSNMRGNGSSSVDGNGGSNWNGAWVRAVDRPVRFRRGNGGGGGGDGRLMVITGGAGFVGANLANRLLEQGERVRILDDFSRPGVERNANWLRECHGDRVHVMVGDVRDAGIVERVVADSAFVFHLAAQVAVTTSLEKPREDHAVNVLGTLNVLEAIRLSPHQPGLIFASTNKVYGALLGLALQREGRRYVPCDETVRESGICEEQPLDFVSPYGCSKGAAEQYVLDYCRSYGLQATALRLSCIYGPRQRANGDQGWVTHFLRSALLERQLTIYGDGCQVRDVLYIDDLISALLLARQHIDRISGRPFNLGGGAAYGLSLLELIEAAETLCGRSIEPHFEEARTGDQGFFAADYRRFAAATGWRPNVPPQAGLARVWNWLLEDTGHDSGREAPIREPLRGTIAP